LDLDAEAPLVVYSGTFEPYQGLDLLVDAIPLVLEAFPRTVFLLIGAPSEHSLAESEIAMRMIQQGNLRILPRLRRGAVPSYLALADILVSPRAYGDNVPLKIFDYMLSGTPIVATDIRGHRSLLSEETAVLVASTSEAIATAIVRLLKDPTFGARISRQALQVAGRSHDGKSFAEKVKALYLEAMGRGNSEARNRDSGSAVS
jgi:glycosyltransferase involved in cell wall biosynthesis